jgi:hypothetical protein
MIEVVTCEKFYKDVAHEPLHPTVPKDPRAPRASSSALVVAPSRTTRRGDASSASSSNTGFLKMFRGIFTMCHRTDHRTDVMEHAYRLLGATRRSYTVSRMSRSLSCPTSLSSHLSPTLMPH